MTDDMLIESHDSRGVVTLTLNRPKVHNAFNDVLIASLTRRLAALERRSEVRAVILAATGSSFSAGADLNWMRSMVDFSEAENVEDALALADLMTLLDRLAKPTIARVNGPVFGGGVGLVTCCDIAVGTPRTKMALTEVKLGLAPAVIAPYVVRTIGPRQARRYFQTAEVMEPDTALQLGLLHEVTPEHALDERVGDFVDALLAAGPLALAASKKLVTMTANAGEVAAESLRLRTAEVIAQLRVSQEGQEGLAAFIEKRPPAWHR